MKSIIDIVAVIVLIFSLLPDTSPNPVPLMFSGYSPSLR